MHVGDASSFWPPTLDSRYFGTGRSPKQVMTKEGEILRVGGESGMEKGLETQDPMFLLLFGLFLTLFLAA